MDNSKLFEPLYQKILVAIEEIIELNKEQRSFDRVIFSLFSIVQDQYPGYRQLSDLKNNFNLFAVSYFLKLFCDNFINKNLIKITSRPIPTATPMSLSILCQYSLFTDTNKSSFLHYLKPNAYFHKKNRGAISIDTEDFSTTRKIGITTLENTPEDLKNYFTTPYSPSQFNFVPDRKSNFGK